MFNVIFCIDICKTIDTYICTYIYIYTSTYTYVHSICIYVYYFVNEVDPINLDEDTNFENTSYMLCVLELKSRFWQMITQLWWYCDIYVCM